MPPIRDYICDYCGHEFEEVVRSQDPEEYEYTHCRCGSKARVLPALIGGYQGDTGASTRPKNSTSMPKAKVFTGPNQGEPESSTKTEVKKTPLRPYKPISQDKEYD